MEQNNIRDFNNETYTVPEGAAIIKELDDRTKHNVDGYNTIAELGVLVESLIELLKRPVIKVNDSLVTLSKHPDNNDATKRSILEKNDYIWMVLWDANELWMCGQYKIDDNTLKNDKANWDRILPTENLITR